MKTNKQFIRGFTIIELLVVMSIIGILASITFVVYSGIQNKAREVSILSDLDRMDALQTEYGIKHNSAGKPYYSIDGNDSDLAFSPSDGNVVNVAVNTADYCIRIYNTNSDHNSIANSLIKESTPGVCAIIVPIYAPAIPVITVVRSGVDVLATITTPPVTPPACPAGAIQYGIRNNINDGTWSEYADWSAVMTATQSVVEGTKYGYQVQARCYANAELISEITEGVAEYYTAPIDSPPVPTITVALNGANVQATIGTPSSCSAQGSVVEYRFAYRANDGTWGSYNTFSAATSSSQTALEGTKAGFNAQARCYIDAVTYSSPSAASPEVTYIHPITSVPATPTVSASTVGVTTTWSWNATSCPSGTSARYQYRYTISPSGYDSGWVVAGTSVAFTTYTAGQTYTVQVQTQCYSSFATGSWSGTGSASYYRPIPIVTAQAWGGGGNGGYGGGTDSHGGGGGGGGAFAMTTNITLLLGSSYNVAVGGVSGDSSFNSNQILAKGGGSNPGGSPGNGTTRTSGGAAASGVGNVKYSGGAGGYYWQSGSGGGGGAAGPDGAGGDGVNSITTGYYSNGGSGDAGYGGAPNSGASVKGGAGGVGGANNDYGGGGGWYGGAGGGGEYGGGGGSSGAVVISYVTNTMSASGGTITTNGGNTIHTFTGSGTFTVN